MATKPDDEDELLLDTPAQDDPPEPPENDDDQDDPPPEGEEEETVISFGDDAPPTDDSPNDSALIKKLRQEIRERDKRLAEVAKPAPPKIEVGERPTLEACEWDEDRLADELLEWTDRKRQAETQQSEAEKAQQEAAERSAKVMAAYAERRAEVTDIDEAEASVAADFGDEFSKALAYASEDPAFIKALHLFPGKRAKLAKLRNDPLKAIFEAGKLAAGVKVTKRRKAPDPDQVERGSGGAPKSTDKVIEKLEKEADRTGDRTKLIEYRKSLRK